MDKEQLDKLILYLNKKGITDITHDYHNIDIEYSKYDIKSIIRLDFYTKYVKYQTPYSNLQYINFTKYITYYRKATYNRRGGDVSKRVGGDDITKLKTKYNRVNFNNAVYKNILLIQTWLDPVLEKQKKEKEDLNDYASELKFYFKDKYGDVKLGISGINIKHITAEIINNEGGTEYHKMEYDNGNYYLRSISTYWNREKEKKVYKQREKIKE